MGTKCREGAGRHEGAAAIWEFLRAQLPSPRTGALPLICHSRSSESPPPPPHPGQGWRAHLPPGPAQRLPLPRHCESRPLGTGCAAPIDGEGPSWCVISLLQERT